MANPFSQAGFSGELLPLSEDELDELDEFLMSDQTSEETMVLEILDGYLTALAIGPVTVMPSVWLPRVWGPAGRPQGQTPLRPQGQTPLKGE